MVKLRPVLIEDQEMKIYKLDEEEAFSGPVEYEEGAVEDVSGPGDSAIKEVYVNVNLMHYPDGSIDFSINYQGEMEVSRSEVKKWFEKYGSHVNERARLVERKFGNCYMYREARWPAEHPYDYGYLNCPVSETMNNSQGHKDSGLGVK